MPTPLPLNPTITDAGLAAVVSAQGNGLQLEITHIALGSGLYTPTGNETALVDEVVRVGIAGGSIVTPTQIQVYSSATAPSPAEAGWIGEIGFYAGTTLFAVFSRPSDPVLYLSDAVYTTINYALGLSALPSGSVTVVVDPNLPTAGLALDAHLADPDPHPQYITEPELSSMIPAPGDIHDALVSLIQSVAPSAVGTHTVSIPVGALRPRATDGCAGVAVAVGAANQPDIDYMAFDGASAEYAKITIPMPKGWDEGTIKADFSWRRASGNIAADVKWGVRAGSASSGDPVPTFGSPAYSVSPAPGSPDEVKISNKTSACSIGGSPSEGDLLFIEFFRAADDNADTLNGVDAHLIGVRLFYETDASTDD